MQAGINVSTLGLDFCQLIVELGVFFRTRNLGGNPDFCGSVQNFGV